MKLVNYFSVCLLIISLPANAQTKNTNHTLLWEVSGKGLTKPSYIFGTYHFIGKNFIDTMVVLNEKLNKAEAVVGELVMDQKEMMKLGPFMLLQNNSLDKILTPEEYEKVNGVMKAKAKTDLKAFNTLNPIAVQVLLMRMFSPVPVNLNTEVIDQYFQSYAKAKNLPVYGLETVEEQGKILFGTKLERQKEVLLKFVNDTVKVKKQGAALYQAYVNQDLKALDQIFAAIEEYTQAEMDEMLKNRNNRWLLKLPDMMTSKSLFIAVGAAHLVGQHGLIKGLRALGYTVKPIATN